MQRSHTARAQLSLHASVMLMFICMMQAKRGTAHRENMYNLQHQGQEEERRRANRAAIKTAQTAARTSSHRAGCGAACRQQATALPRSQRGQRREDRCAAGEIYRGVKRSQHGSINMYGTV